MRHLVKVWAVMILAVGLAAPARADVVQLDISGGFNIDAWCGPREFQQCRLDGAHDLVELYGGLPQGNGQFVMQQNYFPVGDSTGETLAYSITGDSGHPRNLSGTEGIPEDGVLTGADRDYHVASVGGNVTLPGNWTEVADPSTFQNQPNCIVVGSAHGTGDWQIAERVVELPPAQRAQYDDVNLVIAAMNVDDKARNMEVYALYGAEGEQEVLLYAFSTEDGGDGPIMPDNDGGDDFDIVYTTSQGYSVATLATGNVRAYQASLYEFKVPLALNSSKSLWGFKVKDADPGLNWNRRGVAIFAATATVATGANLEPTADAGTDQVVHDTDRTGAETVTLDGSASSDSDGTIVSWVWTEGEDELASGETADVDLPLGTHTITLTVTDNDDATDTDTLVVRVNDPPVADAGPDRVVYDDDETGDETVTLDARNSDDSDGVITSWIWREGASQIAAGETAGVTLDVGQHVIILTATDNNGGTDADTLVVTVSDNHPPIADAGGDRTLADEDDDGQLTVTLDGSGSTDSDGTIAGYAWTDYDGTEIATGESAQVDLGVGIHDIKLTVTDNEGGTDSTVVRVWVMPTVDYWVDQKHPSASDSNPGTADLPWLTVDHAVDSVGAGDVICVREGIYRERVSPGASGTAANPITLMGYPGERVVLSGADELAGWTQCDATTARGNANAASIYYVDIPWKPTRLVQDEVDLAPARTPSDGWWLATGGTTNTLADTANLTQPDDFWNGARIFVWHIYGTVQWERDVIDFDSATGALTINGTWYSTWVIDPGDRYYLSHKVELFDGPGEWVVEDLGGGTWRVFVWPADGVHPDDTMIEASHRDRFVIEYGSRSYWIFDNLEIRHGVSSGIGSYASSCPGHNTVQNCVIHHNDYMGIQGRYNHYGVYRRNVSMFNDYGICNSGATGVLFEENEVAWNLVDGILTTGPGKDSEGNPLYWAENVTVRRNYVHDHYLWGHPDNCQSYSFIRNLLIEDNLLIHAGQGYMMEATEDSTFRGNTIIGSSAYLIIYGHGNVANMTCENNTFCYAGYGLFNLSGDDGYHYKNNILVNGHRSIAWGISDAGTTYSSDYNLFWNGPDIVYDIVRWPGSSSFGQYQSLSGWDTHSAYADPQFTNAPAYFTQLDGGRQHLFTPARLYLSSGDVDLYAVGDHVEVDWDGTDRIVTAVDTDGPWIEIDPGDPQFAIKATQVANWKDNTDFTLDFTLQPGSPAIGAAEDGGNAGSAVNIQNYCAGDFNGDGRRDLPLPPMPPGSAVLEVAAALAPGESWVYQNAETTTADRHASLLTITLVSEAVPGETYDISISDNGPGGANFTLGAAVDNRPDEQTLTVPIIGGRVGMSTPGADGAAYTVTVTVEGLTSTESETADATLALRYIGDVDGSGAPGAQDKQFFNQRLNNVATAYPDRCYDLNGSGGAPNAEDKQVMNQVLNGVSLP